VLINLIVPAMLPSFAHRLVSAKLTHVMLDCKQHVRVLVLAPLVAQVVRTASHVNRMSKVRTHRRLFINETFSVFY
jgi:hypothetical protein